MSRFDFQSDAKAHSGVPSFGRALAVRESRRVAPEAEKNRFQKAIKRSFDILAGLVILAIIGVPYLIVALCVLISMGRPLHYWQVRIGKDGKPFHMYKFRSMMRNSDEFFQDYLAKNSDAKKEWDKYQKLKVDPRVTPFGRIIRKYSIDELPQIFNVLKGDMSLVGPRPVIIWQRSLWGKSPAWRYYCSVRPGITGLWQVSGRNKITFAKRMEMDVDYVSNWSLWLDIKILLATFKVVVQGGGH